MDDVNDTDSPDASCPTEATIDAFMGGNGSEALKQEFEAHLDRCPACRHVVAGLARVAPTAPPGGSHDLRPGQTLGRYTIVRCVGRGAMGAVYLGHDPDLDRSVAIKRLHAPCAGRLLQEARGLARVSHPNVVGVHAVECEHDRVFVAMEYVEGRTLSEWSRRTRRSWQEILRVLVFAGRGLAAVHAAGLVHRDFKPDNVLVGADGRVRLGDFGLVGEFGASETWSSDPDGDRAPSGHDLMITASGSLGGTPAYMAPERLRGEAAGPASDQYAFAVTAYEALYGQRPFSGDRVEALHWNATQGRIDPLPSRRGVPLAVHRVLMRALESDPRARFADMDACLECLRTRARAPRRRSRVGIATVAAFTFAGLAACSRTPTTIASATVCRTPQDLEISR